MWRLIFVFEADRAQCFQAWAELKLWVLSPDEPKPTNYFPRACFEPELYTYKNYKIQAWACFQLFWKLSSSSLGLIYYEPEIRHGLSSLSPGSFHHYFYLDAGTTEKEYRIWKNNYDSYHFTQRDVNPWPFRLPFIFFPCVAPCPLTDAIF